MGFKWSLTEASPDMLSARPRVVSLSGGSLLVAGGRPALNMWLSKDNGVGFTKFDIPTLHNQHVKDTNEQFRQQFENANMSLGWAESSCYTQVLALSADRALVCYERQGAGSGGYDHRNQPKECNPTGSSIYCMRLRIKTDDDALAFEIATSFIKQIQVPASLTEDEISLGPVQIATESAMRDESGAPIRDCLMPHITQFNSTWYAYGFGIPSNATGDQRYGTCYTSTNLATWTKQECTWGLEPPLWNSKNKEYVGIGEKYGHSMSSYISPSPLGPFVLKKTMTSVFGDPGDSSTFVDDDGKAYLIYNRYSGPIAQRFAYIYQLNDDYIDIVPATLSNTTRVMEGLWMLKHKGTYFLFGSPLVVYDDADDFYLTAPSPLGPWTYRGLFAPKGSRTFNSQVFKGLQVTGAKGTATVFIGTRWCNPYPAHTPPPPAVCPPTCVCHPPFRNTTSLWLPLHFNADNSVAELTWADSWTLDTWA
jgi:hypothetical protein